MYSVYLVSHGVYTSYTATFWMRDGVTSEVPWHKYDPSGHRMPEGVEAVAEVAANTTPEGTAEEGVTATATEAAAAVSTGAV